MTQLYTGTVEMTYTDASNSFYEQLTNVSLRVCRQMANRVGCKIDNVEYLSFHYSPITD